MGSTQDRKGTEYGFFRSTIQLKLNGQIFVFGVPPLNRCGTSPPQPTTPFLKGMRMRRVTSLFSLLVAAVLLIGSTTASAQRDSVKTLFDMGPFTSGGFGGPVAKLTSMRGESSLLVGGRGAWIINSTIAIGGGGYGLVTPRTVAEGATPGLDTMYSVGYGGFELEVVLWADEALHASVMTLVGAGGLSTGISRNNDDMDWGWGGNNSLTDDAFFVVEPQVNVEANITPWFRLGVGASYRFVNGVDTKVGSISITDADLSNLSGVLTFKFGLY